MQVWFLNRFTAPKINTGGGGAPFWHNMHRSTCLLSVQSNQISISLMRGRKNDRFQFTLSVCVNKACAHLRIIEFARGVRSLAHQNFSDNFTFPPMELIRRRLIQFRIHASSQQKGFIYMRGLCIVRLFTSRRGQWVRTQQYTEWILCLRIAGWVSERRALAAIRACPLEEPLPQTICDRRAGAVSRFHTSKAQWKWHKKFANYFSELQKFKF